MSNDNTNVEDRPVFFASADTDLVMQTLILAMEDTVFPSGAPARPNVPLGEGDSSQTTTSSGLSLKGDAFEAPPVHIPVCGDGANHRHSYKSELTLFRAETGTKKILWWHADDPREEPHNHPWNFRSGILRGGYTEERFWVTNGVVHKERIIYKAGQINEVPADVFHNVVDVKPGTVTYLDCGPAREGNLWGYMMNTATGEYRDFKENTPDNFIECFHGLNPHLRKK